MKDLYLTEDEKRNLKKVLVYWLRTWPNEEGNEHISRILKRLKRKDPKDD